jgi:hypothetical protein
MLVLSRFAPLKDWFAAERALIITANALNADLRYTSVS